MDTMTTPIGANWRNQGGAHGRIVDPSGRVNQIRSVGTLRCSLAFTGGLARIRVAGGPGSSLYPIVA